MSIIKMIQDIELTKEEEEQLVFEKRLAEAEEADDGYCEYGRMSDEDINNLN